MQSMMFPKDQGSRQMRARSTLNGGGSGSNYTPLIKRVLGNELYRVNGAIKQKYLLNILKLNLHVRNRTQLKLLNLLNINVLK